MERIPAVIMHRPLDLQNQSTGLHQRRNEQQMLIYDAGTERQRERCTWYLLLFGTKKCPRYTHHAWALTGICAGVTFA